MNLHQKIAAVMADIQYLAKDGTVEAGFGKSYKAITEEKVTSACRASMIKNGLVLLQKSIEHSRIDEPITDKQGNPKMNRVTTVYVTYRLVNTDDPADYEEIVSVGYGVDTQDKGIGKAITYAYKYALLRTFAIPTGEDADKISSEVYTEQLMGSDKRGDEKEAKDMIEVVLGLGRLQAGSDGTDEANKAADARTMAFAKAVAEKNGYTHTDLQKMTRDEAAGVKIALARRAEK